MLSVPEDFEYEVDKHGFLVKERVRNPRWSSYPIGTKAHSFLGGFWFRNEEGWKASSGATFPTPGGDASAVSLPLRRK